MKKIFITITLLCLVIPLFADEVDFSGDLETTWGVAAPWTNSDTAAGRFTLGSTSFTGKVDAYYGNSSACAEGTFSYNAVEQAGNLDQGFNISLNELWVDYSESFWGLRVGRQKSAWGKADGVDITNVLCPADMSSIAAMVSEDSKMAVDAVRLSGNFSSFTADFWWIPFFTPAVLPTNQAVITKPELAIWNGEYGLKLSGYFSALDFSLYGFYGWDDIPLFDYTMVNASGEYKRMLMVGADAALPLGETVIRLETAFFPERYLQRVAQNIIQEKITNSMIAMASANQPAAVENTLQRNQLSGLAGIDWMPSSWTLTAQYYCDYVFGDIESLERKNSYQHGITICVSKSLLFERLEVSLSGLAGLNDFDSMIVPKVKYSLSDQFSLACGAYILNAGPEKDGKYGSYKDYSSLFVNGKFSF